MAFATPVFVAGHNTGDLVLPFPAMVAGFAALCMFLSGLSYALAAMAGNRWQWWFSRILLALALVSAVQGNVIHELFYYGAFNGEQVNLRAYGWLFQAEWLGWLLALVLTFSVLSRLKKIPLWLPSLPLISFALLLLPLTAARPAGTSAHADNAVVDPSVFAFSSVGNLIHLLPDGLQGSMVAKVLAQSPELAALFEGFTLYTNHLGLYQGTAPALYTIFTGEPFALEKGHGAQRVKDEIVAKSYQKALHESGYQLDYVPIGDYVCPEYVSSCTPRPFNDMKARGYFRHRTEDLIYSFRLIADLSLFRLTPMYLKEKIYDDGQWLISDTTMDGSSPWPDPVIHEWAERMTIVDDRMVYKWYHYIGGHIPPHWDADCNYLRKPAPSRENYEAQTYCILSDIGMLLDRLRQAGIYDQTAIIISSDHGHNTAPYDLVAPPLNGSLSPGMLGSGRPTLLVKGKNNRDALVFDASPTSLIDVAPTALALAGIPGEWPDVSTFAGIGRRERYFTPFSIAKLWTGDPIPFARYRVDGPVNDGSEWLLTGIQPFAPAPEAYEAVNYTNSWGYMLGAALDRNHPDKEASWIDGRQLGFLLSMPVTSGERMLQLTLNVPEWMDQQDVTIFVNGATVEVNRPVQQGAEYWQTINVPLDSRFLHAGNNFFSLLFGRAYHPPDRPDWNASALLKAIRIVDNPEISSPPGL